MRLFKIRRDFYRLSGGAWSVWFSYGTPIACQIGSGKVYMSKPQHTIGISRHREWLREQLGATECQDEFVETMEFLPR